MRTIAIVVAPVIMVTITAAASAQDKARLEYFMNASALCSPLKLNTSTIRTLIPYKIPGAIPNTDIGIDKNAHRVNEFEIAADSAKISGEFGCQPSDQGVPFKFPFSEKPENWRVTDNFSCQAQMAANIVISINCTTSGAVGNLIATVSKVDDQMKSILQDSLK